MALILSRRPGETLVFKTASGELITVTILGLNAKQIQIGIEAPKSTRVDREEIYRKKKAERVA